MYDQHELDQLVAAMRTTGTTVLAVKTNGKRLRLTLPPGITLSDAIAAIRHVDAKSPCIGTFTPRGADDGLPLLEPGAAISTDEVLGYVAQGAALMAVIAPGAGRFTGQPPLPGQICGHGDILFSIESAI